MLSLAVVLLVLLGEGHGLKCGGETCDLYGNANCWCVLEPCMDSSESGESSLLNWSGEWAGETGWRCPTEKESTEGFCLKEDDHKYGDCEICEDKKCPEKQMNMDQ